MEWVVSRSLDVSFGSAVFGVACSVPVVGVVSSRSVAAAGLNWNLLPPQSGHPDSISLEPSANTRPHVVHSCGIYL